MLNKIKMTKLLILIACCWLVLCSFTTDGIKLVKTKITKEVTVSLPANFVPMTDDDMAKKYFTYRKPTAMYTNPDRLVDFGFNETATRWRKTDLPILQKFYKSSIVSMHNKVDFKQETIATINNRDFVIFEFTSEVTDEESNSLQKGGVTRQYSYIQYTIENNKVLVFNFTCPYQMKDKWQEVAKEIMASIKISS